MSNLRIHIYYALSFVAAGCIAYYFFFQGRPSVQAAAIPVQSSSVPAQSDFRLTSQKGYKNIQPLLLANQAGESPAFSSLKAQVQNVISDNQRLGLLSTATVYLSSLSDGRWMYINPNEMYSPASLIKVPMLMTFLKESEANLALLDKKIMFDASNAVPTQTYTTQSLKNGNSYTVRELLRYMVAYSDNNATKLLNQMVVVKDFVKTFTDFNLPEPNVSDRNYKIGAREISNFYSALFYATYVSRTNSEFGMELLTQCDFKDGMTKELPASVRVAHKFGEWGDNRINVHELHEVGIVYLEGKPYLLTVMTRGNYTKDLTAVISKISRLVYDDFTTANGNQSM